MFGCIFSLFRLVAICAILALVGGGIYYYSKRKPESPPWKAGVAAVQDKLATATVSAEVKAAIALRESLRGHEITVSAEKDIVTLRGKVANPEALRAAEEVAGSVPGVRQVVSFLEVDKALGTKTTTAPDRSIGERLDDEALELKVRAAFKLDRSLAEAAFEVKAMRRTILLSSATATADQKRRAAAVARSVIGVESVESR